LLKEKKEILERELSSQKAAFENFTRTLAEAREELASHVSRLDSLKEIVLDKPTRELLSASARYGLRHLFLMFLRSRQRMKKPLKVRFPRRRIHLLSSPGKTSNKR